MRTPVTGNNKKSTFNNATRTNAFTFDPNDLMLIEDENHPLYDSRVAMPLDEALVKSIMYQGVIEPVVVTKQEGQPVVVDGRQRVRCAREANKRLLEMGREPVRVVCVVKRGDESDLFGVAISANENRQDDTPLGRAHKCVRYLAMGRTEEEAAITFGVTRQCIQQWLKLLDCSAPVRKAVEEGKLAASAAVSLADLPTAEQTDALSALLADSRQTGKRVTARKAAKAAGKAAGKMKGKREIRKKLEETGLPSGFKAALKWVLGDE